MALSNYSELKTAIAAWMKRSDLTAKIPDYITLAEKKIVKIGKIRQFEVETPLVGTASSDVVALPSDFESPIGLWDTSDNPRCQMVQVLPQALPVDTTPAQAEFFAIDGANIRFECPLDAVYTYSLRYRKKFALSDANPTNYVLTDYPDVYLYGALVEGFSDVFDEDRAAVWQQRFRTAIELMNSAESMKNNNVGLRTEMGSSERFDIYRGY